MEEKDLSDMTPISMFVFDPTSIFLTRPTHHGHGRRGNPFLAWRGQVSSTESMVTVCALTASSPKVNQKPTVWLGLDLRGATWFPDSADHTVPEAFQNTRPEVFFCASSAAVQ